MVYSATLCPILSFQLRVQGETNRYFALIFSLIFSFGNHVINLIFSFGTHVINLIFSFGNHVINLVPTLGTQDVKNPD